MKIVENYMKVFAISGFLLLFLGCKKENRCDCIKRTGSIITETRSVSDFYNVTVEDNVNVFITQDSFFEVLVEAGKNIAPLIKTEVTNGTLSIRNDNRCNWTRSYKKPFNVYIKMPVVKYILSKGTGTVKSLNVIISDSIDLETQNSGNMEFTVNNFKVTSHMYGYGDITLHGTTQEHACSIGGDGFMYASDLHTSYTWIQSFTSGLSYIYATNLLICTIDKTGDVYCYGNPTTVQKSLNGSGQLYLQ